MVHNLYYMYFLGFVPTRMHRKGQENLKNDNLKHIAHVHPSNTTRTIDFLEEKGYVIKSVREEDKRICMLFPTDKLFEVYKVLEVAENNWIDIITEGMSEEELESYKKFLSISTELSSKYIHK